MRTALVSALALGLALPAAAQTTFGVRAGLNVSSLRLGFEEGGGGTFEGRDGTPRLGFTGGVFAEIPLSPTVALRPEVLFSQKGEAFSRTVSVNGGSFESEIDVQLSYVEVPVLVRVAVPVGRGLGVALLAGPAVALEVGESVRSESRSDGEPRPGGGAVLDADVFRSADVGLVVGAEVGAGPFAVGLRLTEGLLDVSDPGSGELNQGIEFRNRAVSVTGVLRLGR